MVVDDNLVDNYVIFSAPLKTIGATFSSQTSANGSVEKKRLSIITLRETISPGVDMSRVHCSTQRDLIFCDEHSKLEPENIQGLISQKNLQRLR